CVEEPKNPRPGGFDQLRALSGGRVPGVRIAVHAGKEPFGVLPNQRLRVQGAPRVIQIHEARSIQPAVLLRPELPNLLVHRLRSPARPRPSNGAAAGVPGSAARYGSHDLSTRNSE